MLSQRIQQHFIDSADLNYQCAQLLAAPVEAAVNALLACVTSGNKVLACGLGGSAAAAQYFTASFVGRFERDRPELAATALSADTTVLTALAQGQLAQIAAEELDISLDRLAWRAGDIKELRAPDPYTVEYELVEPFSELHNYAYNCIIML